MGGVVSSIANVFTGANSTKDAGNAAAAQMSQAARDAAAAAQFRPVGMTTAFGTSQFTREIDQQLECLISLVLVTLLHLS